MFARIASWFRDATIRRVMKHGLTVSMGKTIGQVISLASIAVLTRQLGPDEFGVLALIRSVAGITEGYANFNTWQAVIRYAPLAKAAGRDDDVKAIIKLAMLIDVSTAAVAALVIAGLAFIVPKAFGWSHHEATLCALYALTVLTRVAGRPEALQAVSAPHLGTVSGLFVVSSHHPATSRANEFLRVSRDDRRAAGV